MTYGAVMDDNSPNKHWKQHLPCTCICFNKKKTAKTKIRWKTTLRFR